MIGTSDSICGIYMYIQSLYMQVKHIACMAYMPNSMVIFVSYTYLAITCVVEVAVCCIGIYMQKC